MDEFDKIYLSWRTGTSSRRHIVGLLQEKPEGGYLFNYLPVAKELVFKEFAPYLEFQDLDKTYNSNVVDIFATRLMKTDRIDIRKFFDFWAIDERKAYDKFYMLGKTQGLVATDNFEFLADYKMTDQLHFVTDLAGISHKDPLAKGTLIIEDELRFEFEPENEGDPEAVKVLKGDLELGYIKKIHCRVFHQPGADRIKLKVKALEQNGVIKKVFIEVSLKD